MESLVNDAKSALLNSDLAPVWFRQLLHNNVFLESRFHITLHEVWNHASSDTYSSIEIYEAQKLVDRIQGAHPSASHQTPTAQLKLVKVHSMSSHDFLDLLKLFNIDDAALLVMNSGPFHFQHFGDSANITFGMAYNVATMLWSYNSRHQDVYAIAIGEGDLPFNQAQVERFKANLSHPLALGLLALQIQLESFHGTNRSLVNKLRDVETDTGHRGKNQSAGRMDFPTLERLDLDSISQTVSNIHYVGLSLQRTFRAMKLIVQEMLDLTDNGLLAQQAQQTTRAHSFRTSLVWRLKAIDSLLEQVQYLLNRVGVQETVVVNLRAQKDAKYSLKLAASSAKSAVASMELAASTKKDSSSMQTIAIVTMALLPATYFAALFAMPLLQWDRNPVIQDGFWVYLAFTLPSTAIVFILWFLITKTNFFRPLTLQLERFLKSDHY